MTMPNTERLFKELREVFPAEAPESAVVDYVFAAIRDGHRVVTPWHIAKALKLEDREQDRRRLVRVLDFLGEEGVLSKKFQLWSPYPDTDCLEQPVAELSSAQMREALENHELIDPNTGEIVPDFMNHVTFTYEVSEWASTADFRGYRK